MICDLNPDDVGRILALNNAHAAETSLLDEVGLRSLLSMACYARGIDRGATAFLIALDPRADYDSLNYRWFQAHRDSFVYIDRVIVAPSARGQGLARKLYQDLFSDAQWNGTPLAVCEVNLHPANPISLAFHAALDFVETGRATIHGGLKTVAYLEKPLSLTC